MINNNDKDNKKQNKSENLKENSHDNQNQKQTKNQQIQNNEGSVISVTSILTFVTCEFLCLQ